MSPNAVSHAARQGSQSATEAALATGPGVRCFLPNALSVAKTRKYPLNHVGTSRCTVAIATAKSLALALTTEVADMAVGEVVNLAEEEREDIKLPIHSFPLVW